ncbi:MAG: hypothetical protein ACPG3V_09200 [Porticoccaceae bacterium]
MEHMSDCFDLVDEAWNRWGSAQVTYISGTGPMRDKKGNILPESLLGDYEAHEFKVGVRPSIWCIWDGEQLTLSKYPASYKPLAETYAPPDNI